MAVIPTKAPHVVLSAALWALLGACSVGEVNGPGIGPDGGALPDGSGGGDGGGMARLACEPGQTPGQAHIHADGGERKGESCLQGGCHLLGGDGPTFSLGGTAYTTAAGGGDLPQAGSVVRLWQMDGNTLVRAAVTDSAGNFYSTEPIPPGSYLTDITECGTTPLEVRPMSARVATVSGDMSCSRAGCHGTTTPRIFLGP